MNNQENKIEELLPMIGLSTLDDFVQSPPPFLKLISTSPLQWAVNRNLVNICVDPKRHLYFRGAVGNVIKFETAEKFENIVKSLLSKPLVLEVNLEAGTRCRSIGVHYFVTVNTSHPVIKGQILDAVNGVRTRVTNEGPVVLKIDFNNVIDCWFREMPGYRGSKTSNTASRAEVVITSKPDVHPCFRGVVLGTGIIGGAIMLTFLLCCVTYYAVREIRTSNKKSRIQGEIKHLTWRNNVPVSSTDFAINFGEN
ncbi:hypothetical protein HOLleu_35181 [Holothuria leucospilota]|uniref:Uncharacterized protein n=1 Tax=Holothuria leucospilota TaxID=206669 RepID=A0A9Q0YRL2_HOLLE|nr:hypothetical protein HOLleu_35181 [Holothuria leucospilota]